MKWGIIPENDTRKGRAFQRKSRRGPGGRSLVNGLSSGPGRISTAVHGPPREFHEPEDLQVHEHTRGLGPAQVLADTGQGDLDDLDDLVVVASGFSHLFKPGAKVGPEDLGGSTRGHGSLGQEAELSCGPAGLLDQLPARGILHGFPGVHQACRELDDVPAKGRAELFFEKDRIRRCDRHHHHDAADVDTLDRLPGAHRALCVAVVDLHGAHELALPADYFIDDLHKKAPLRRRDAEKSWRKV